MLKGGKKCEKCVRVKQMYMWGEGERLESMRGEGSKKRKEIIEVEDTEDGDDEEDVQPLQKVAQSKWNFISLFAIFLLTSNFVAENFQTSMRFAEAGPSRRMSEKMMGKQRMDLKDLTTQVAVEEVRKIELVKWQAKEMMCELELQKIWKIIERLEEGL
jgi:hypothetical protein